MAIRISFWVVAALLASPLVHAGRASAGAILFVDSSAAGANNGLSWTDAYNDLQAALNRARLFGGVEGIWVAAGSYRPAPAGGDRSASFELINGVALLGGFEGGETSADQRNPRVHRTVLSGDLNNDDDQPLGNSSCCVSHGSVGCDDSECQALVCAEDEFCCNEERGSWDVNCVHLTICLCGDLCSRICDNSYHVVSARSVGSTAVLDGFVISDGAANGDPMPQRRGAGIFIENASPTIVGCVFFNNTADAEGGAAAINGSPHVINCSFFGNTASRGAAVAVLAGNPLFANCVFSGNDAGSDGGALMVLGAMPVLDNCTISRNTARQDGGGIRAENSLRTEVNNSILWGNRDRNGVGTGASAQISFDLASRILVSYSDVQGFPNSFPGPGNIAVDPLFVRPDGEDHIPGTLDDDYHLLPNSPCIDAGGNSLVPPDSFDLDGDGVLAEPLPLDRDGENRFFDDPLSPNTGEGAPPIVDMGAYEVASDCNDNGLLDDKDVANQTSEDCNGNLIPDECEIRVNSPAPGGPFFCTLDCDPDCNADGIPDACQPDADQDGLTDVCDQCPNTPPGVPVDARGCSLPGACCLVAGTVCFDGLQDVSCANINGNFLGYGLTCASDGDGDGVRGCLDHCPDDPFKSEPGVCGCGVSDDDVDDDDVPGCIDPCPLDNPDDTDGDGLCDSLDPCPLDESGDTDGDGVCDSDDPCPLDNPDDRDGDGICNSLDLCPDDPGKGEPGVCGCGIPELDADADGVIDCRDECLGSPPGVPVDDQGCPALGACCFQVGVCADDARQADCRVVGGIYQGHRSLCSEGCAVPGDLERDGDVDIDDHGLFVDCIVNPGTGNTNGCALADFDGDGRIDLRDTGAFQRAFTGPMP